MSMLHWAVLDFETRSLANIKKVGAWRYAEDFSTEVLCINWNVDGGPWRAWWPGEPQEELLELVCNDLVCFISFGDFERAMWRKHVMETYSWPDIPNERWHDIQAAAAMKNMPKDLDTLLRVLNGPAKDMDGNKITIGLSKTDKHGNLPEVTPAIRSRVIEYCGTDIDTETFAHKALGWLQPGERRYWLLNQKINERGIRLDLDYIDACKQVAREAAIPLNAEFVKLVGCNPTQRDKFLTWMDEQGVQLPNLTKETLAEVLSEADDDADDETYQPMDDTEREAAGYLPTLRGIVLPDNVRRALSIRKLVGASSLAKLTAMEACVGYDGRARGLLQYHGTGPGRSAGRLLQPHNFPKPTVKGLDGELIDSKVIVDAIMTRDPEWVEMVVGPPIETVVSGLRQSMIADEDKEFVSGDYAGIQARLVLALAGQYDKVSLMADPAVDIYCDMASQIFKKEITKQNKKLYPKERGTGKNAVLGLGFQMGGPTFQRKYARKDPLEFCSEVVRVYRKEWAPKVPYLWYGLEDAATRAVWTGEPQEYAGIVYNVEGAWLTCRLHSGRKMFYYNPTPVRTPAPWDADQIKEGFTFQALKNHVWRTVYAFGGQLAENVIMGMEADIMRTAQLKLEANGFPIVLEVHDECVGMPMKADADLKAFHQIMLDNDQWVKDLKVPIAVDGWVSNRYEK